MAEAQDNRPPKVIPSLKELTIPPLVKRDESYSSSAESTTVREDWYLPKSQVVINKANTTSEVINTDIRKQLVSWFKSGNLAKKIDAFIYYAERGGDDVIAKQLRGLLNQLITVNGVKVKHGDLLQEMAQNSSESMELRRGKVIKYLEENINPYLLPGNRINFQEAYSANDIQFQALDLSSKRIR